jgi:hypothetical protein
MTYVDDVVITGRLQDVEEVITWLAEQTNKIRLGIFKRKTKFMIVSSKSLQRQWICRIWYL